jgi:Predicted membrane-bound metal-dependent hydrolase (DUF457).
MANFRTHLVGAAGVSSVVSTALMVAGVADPRQLTICFILGVIGGLLPDIDADNSRPVKCTFSVLGTALGLAAIFRKGDSFSLVELCLLWAGCFVVVRYGLFTLFTRYTVHRGIIHSLPAGFLCGLATVILSDRVFHSTALQCWLHGTFITLGFLVHLCLDELCSVDITGVRLKASFGTALKLGSAQNPAGTLALYVFLLIAYFQSPEPSAFYHKLFSQETYTMLRTRLVPAGDWFASSDQRVQVRHQDVRQRAKR